jgi:formate hydrogenlyase transcriptional activator
VEIGNQQPFDEAIVVEADIALAAERWRSVFKNSAIGVALTDPNGRFLATNPVFQQMLGYTEKELRAISFLDITHEDFLASNRLLAMELLNGKRDQFQIEKQYRRKDGTFIWVRNNVSLIPGKEGAPKFKLVLSEDISVQKRAQEALRKSEERWRSVFDNSAIGVAIADVDGRLLATNPVFQRMLGYTEEELRSLSFVEITHEDFRESNWALATELLEGKRQQFQIEKQYRRKDGTLIWVRNNVSLVPGTELAPRFTMALSEDITERKRTEDALRKNEERQRTLLEINNAIITNLSEAALLRSIADALRSVIPFDRCAITVYQPESNTLRFLAVEGPRASDYFQVGLEVAPSETSAGWVFEHQQVLLRNNLEEQKEFPNEHRLSAEGMRSICVAPLIFAGKSLGTLSFVSHKRDQYSQADAQFLQEVANQVALAIENMKSYGEITALNAQVARSAEHLRTLLEINNAIITNLTQEALLSSISSAMRRVLAFDGAALTLYIPERDSFRYLAVETGTFSDYLRAGREFSRTDSIAGWAFEQQVAVMRCDLEKEQQYPNDRHLVKEGIRSDCLVPLIVGGNCIGTLNVGSKSKNQYVESDLGFLQEVGNQVALAVANMQSYEEIAALKARLEKENVYLQEEIRAEHNFEEIVGNSPALLELLQQLDQIAPTDSTVLISGETGTGKELIARAIHDRSARKARPLVKVNCGAIPAGLVESELFGHVKGAFTGAMQSRTGRFELANGGTLFLDEVGELPVDTQVKLLRVLQEQEFEPVGSSRTIHVDVRIIAATNRDLEEAVRTGRFRSDVYYRLNVLPLRVPPLRERRTDIPKLVLFFLGRFSRKFGKKINSVSQEIMDHFINYSWPGNIRELQNVVERCVALSRGPVLNMGYPAEPSTTSPYCSDADEGPEIMKVIAKDSKPSGLASMDDIERSHIIAVLNQTRWVIEGPNGAAKILQLNPNTLRHRMKKLGIKRPTHHAS